MTTRCLACAACFWLAAAAVGVGAAAPQPVAVVDFELAGGRADAKDWAFGLADVLAVELRQRGVVLFERQQIRMVLGERHITASGLMHLPKMPAPAIPDLQYLVTGSIRPLPNQQFHLEASLVEARTGRNAASFAREGEYPKALPGALTALAGQLAARLNSTGTAAPPGPVAGGRPTRTPEASLVRCWREVTWSSGNYTTAALGVRAAQILAQLHDL